MRREWHGLREWALGVAVVWFLVGLVLLIVVAGSSRRCDADHVCGFNSDQAAPLHVVLAILVPWLGPFALAAAAAFVRYVLPMAWRARPRRRWVPIETDLRETDG